MVQDYFPKVSEPQGFPIKIQDTSGNDWDFRFRYWPNNNSTMYVLEGLKEYMISKKCQAGDKGNSFYSSLIVIEWSFVLLMMLLYLFPS